MKYKLQYFQFSQSSPGTTAYLVSSSSSACWIVSASFFVLQCVASLLSLETRRCNSCLLSCSSSSCSFSTSHSCRTELRLLLSACLHCQHKRSMQEFEWNSKHLDTGFSRLPYRDQNTNSDLDLLIQNFLQVFELGLQHSPGPAQLAGSAFCLLHLSSHICIISWQDTEECWLWKHCRIHRDYTAPNACFLPTL